MKKRRRDTSKPAAKRRTQRPKKQRRRHVRIRLTKEQKKQRKDTILAFRANTSSAFETFIVGGLLALVARYHPIFGRPLESPDHFDALESVNSQETPKK